jgi:hypothetical protein
MGQSAPSIEPSAAPAGNPTTLSPKRKGGAVKLNRNPNNDGDEMFSPTSAAALALSTLHHFGADRGSQRPSAEALKGTRLFNSGSKSSPAAGAGDTPGPHSSGKPNKKQNSDQAATNAPSSAPPTGVHYSSYRSGSPSNGTAPHYPPHPHHGHAHHPHPHSYPHFGHDPRFERWTPQPPHPRAPGDSSSSQPPSSSPWSAANQFAYPPAPGSNYRMEVSGCWNSFSVCVWNQLESHIRSLSSSIREIQEVMDRLHLWWAHRLLRPETARVVGPMEDTTIHT